MFKTPDVWLWPSFTHVHMHDLTHISTAISVVPNNWISHPQLTFQNKLQTNLFWNSQSKIWFRDWGSDSISMTFFWSSLCTKFTLSVDCAYSDNIVQSTILGWVCWVLVPILFPGALRFIHVPFPVTCFAQIL